MTEAAEPPAPTPGRPRIQPLPAIIADKYRIRKNIVTSRIDHDPAEDGRSARHFAARYEREYHGPVMDPDTAREWRDLVPDAPERLLAMAEREQLHRLDMERREADLLSQEIALEAKELETDQRVISTQDKHQSKALALAFAVAILCVLGAIYSIYLQAPWPVSVAFLAAPMAGVIRQFLVARATSPRPTKNSPAEAPRQTAE